MQTAFGSRLAQLASNARGSPALAMPESEMSYAELLRRVQSCAAWLAGEGCESSQVVGITIADDITHLVTSFALLALGVPQVCLPTHDPASKRSYLAERLAVGRVIATDPRHALPGRPVSLLTSERPGSPGRAFGAIDPDADAPAIYHTSSGTTGEPKIFALSQRQLAWRAERYVESERTGPEYRALTLIPIEHPMSRAHWLHTLWAGCTCVAGGDSAASMQELCVRLNVTDLELSVLHVASAVNDPTDPRPLPAGTAAYTGGAPVAAKLRKQFKARFGVPLRIHYGAREFGRISAHRPGRGEDDFETMGHPVPWIELEIVDGEGKAVPPGEIGEVRVRCEHMLHEYYHDPVATSRHFRDGWFYPRDQASLTPDGALRLHGRTDDMMNLNSIKIFPAEIERVLEEHPAVRAAAAFPKSSAAHGEIPIAAVELHEPGAVGAEELMARARERLGPRAPRKIIVLDSLPRNAAGKVVKYALAALLAPDK